MSCYPVLEQPDWFSVQRWHYSEQRFRQRPDRLVGAVWREGRREQLAVRQQVRFSEEQGPAVAQRLPEDPDADQPPLHPLR